MIKPYSETDSFTKGYVTTALWSSTDEQGEPLDCYGWDDLSDDAQSEILEDCAAFQDDHWDLIRSDPHRAGGDFWLTRNHHGAGFWDGDWPKPAATILTDAAHIYGSSDLYEGDDGKLYLA